MTVMRWHFGQIRCRPVTDHVGEPSLQWAHLSPATGAGSFGAFVIVAKIMTQNWRNAKDGKFG
jgi:hypothetical protein